MPAKNKKHETGCPVAFTLNSFGDRWSLLIVRDMLFRGASTYGQFLEANEGFATNILANRLKQLEDNGIITKSRDPANGRKIIYKLTQKGVDFAPTLFEIILWSAKHDPDGIDLTTMKQRILTDRENFLKEIRDRLSEE